MAENKKAVSLDELSHFKAKQDLYNANTYQKKGETDLTGTVRYDTAQALTEEQKAQARFNIGVDLTDGGGTAEGAVRYDVEQSLDDDDKARARENIGTTDGTWESMPDKPFGEGGGTKIEWDGTPTDVYESFDMDGTTGYFYKVSEPVDTIIDGICTIQADGGVEEVPVSPDIVQVTDGGENGMYIMNVKVPNSTFDFSNAFGAIVTFREIGLYFFCTNVDGEESKITSFTSSDYEIKKIDKKYLPDDIGVPDNVVTTDESGLIPASKLPSYVDDVVEGYYWDEPNYEPEFRKEDGSTITPESGKIYVDLNTGNTYRWSGSVYVRLNPDEITFATTSDIDELFNQGGD